MANYSYAAYGPNPWTGRNVNADNGWGSWKWPAGVPANLLTSFTVPAGGGLAHLTFRSELVELVRLSFQIAEMHGYTIWAKYNGEVWGPWSYENRAISGTSSASNHSRGRAWDINAPNNPYHDPLICDMPPGMVNHFETIGWAWGGRYSRRKDAMHYEAIITPSEVPTYVAKARAILGTSSSNSITATPPTATTPAKDWFSMATAADLQKIVHAEVVAAEARINAHVDAEINERLGFYLPRMMNTLWNGQGNKAFGFTKEGVASTLALNGVGLAGLIRNPALNPQPLKPPATTPPATTPPAATKPATPVATTQKYTVKAGDGFDAIAAKYKTDRAGLQKLNPTVKNVNDIAINQVLTVPK